MNFKKGFDDKKWVPYTIAACTAVVLYVCLIKLNVILAAVGNFIGMLSPVVSGIVLAYLINPLVNHLEQHLYRGIAKEKLRRTLANFTSFLILLLLIILLLSILVPQLIDSVLMFVSNLNIYAETAQEIIDTIVEYGEHMNLDMSVLNTVSSGFLQRIVNFISENSGNIARSSLSLGNNTINLLLGCILAIYFLSAKQLIMDTFYRVLRCILSTEHFGPVTAFLKECNNIMSTYVVSDIVDALIVGAVNAVFMMIMQMPYGVMVSVIVAVTNLLPTFGPVIGAVMGALILLFADPKAAIVFLLFTVILQAIDGYVIKPKLFGDALGVPGVWVTLGIIAGGKVFGIIGVALSVPVVAILNYLFSGMIAKREAVLNVSSSAGDEAGSAEAEKIEK